MNEFESLERRHLGAVAIKHSLGPNLIRGLVASVLLHGTLISLPVAVSWIAPGHLAVVTSGPLTGPVLILPPLGHEAPWIPPKPLRPSAPKAPAVGKWVPAPHDPEIDSTLIRPPSAPIGGAGEVGIGGIGGDDTVGAIDGFILPEDTIPSDTVFMPVEIVPQMIPGMCPGPDFPELARIASLDGKVVVKVWVDRFGDVGKWKIVQVVPAGLGFEEEVLKVVPRWKFTPAVQQGRAVGLWVSIPFKFVCKR
jgi:TonB family protein